MLTAILLRLFNQSPLWQAARQIGLLRLPPADWTTNPLTSDTLRLNGRWIRDAQGRALLLRGFNLSANAKVPPYRPIPDEDHLDRLAEWGMNCIRLVLVWEAIEPQRGHYDEAYLAAMVKLAQAAWQRGIYTIVDVHQDLFSRALGGSGAPTWTHPPIRRPGLLPSRFWFSNYMLNPDVAWAFERFWNNADFIRDSFIRMWREVAQRFATVEGVLGYDVLNEPATRFFPDMLSGHFDRDTLPVFYQQVIAAIRTVDPQRLILVEPSPLASLGFPSLLSHRHEASALHEIAGLIYAPHMYDGLTVASGRFSGDSAIMRHTLQLHLNTAARLQAGLIIGEFGVLNHLHGAHDLYATKLNLFDRYMLNWIAWNYMVGEDYWNDEDISVIYLDGRERAQVDVLVRPYPCATAGTPLGLSFDYPSRSFVFAYTPDPHIAAPTELFLPLRHYPRGFDLRLSPGLTATYDEQQHLLLLRHDPAVTYAACALYRK